MFRDKTPQAWKLARVLPISKGGNLTDALNYRPMSVLPVLSKMLERLVLIGYTNISMTTIFYQIANCPQLSTENIRMALDEGRAVGFVTMDLKKCFDLIPHEVIIEKLRKYGVHSESLVWFKNYLTLGSKL